MRDILISLGFYVALLLLQVLVFNHLTLFDLATPHVFLVFLLMLPLSLRFPIALIIAFFAGLLVDVFSTNMFIGIHAFSCVLMMSLRNLWVEVVTTRQAFRGNEESFLTFQPTSWYVSYLAPLILVHHLAYFLLEAFGFQHFGLTLVKAVLSTVFTFVVILGFVLLFYRRSSRR